MKNDEPGNFFSNVPSMITEEIIENILITGNVRIERIISQGHVSPENFWYDQDENEWVMVLQGQAKLLFEEGMRAVSLAAGDYINIPRHVKHRVEWTLPDDTTIWVAVFY